MVGTTLLKPAIFLALQWMPGLRQPARVGYRGSGAITRGYARARALETRDCAWDRAALTDLVPFQAASICGTYAS